MLLEFIAIITSLIYVVLNARQHIISWIFGLVSSILYIHLFASAGLYASSLLSIIFSCSMVYGWCTWRKEQTSIHSFKISELTCMQRLWTIGIGIALSLTIYTLFIKFAGTSLPLGDATITGFSIIAQILAAKKVLETWYLWGFVNILAVVVYAASGLWATAGLYAVYIGLAAYGLYQWKYSIKTQVVS